MDEEDTGEFGINPQRIQTTTDFSATPKQQGQASAVDGNPVVNLFLIPPKDRTCVSLLKRMGWRGEKCMLSYINYKSISDKLMVNIV